MWRGESSKRKKKIKEYKLKKSYSLLKQSWRKQNLKKLILKSKRECVKKS